MYFEEESGIPIPLYPPLFVSVNCVIKYKKFERSSNWNENVVSKYILETHGRDSTQELISTFDKLTSK